MASVTTHSPAARLTLFGFTPTAADVEIIHRPRSWRATRALLSIAVAVGVAPVAALVPPHLPWPIVALGAGLYLAVRRWTERYTLRSLAGRCPKCGHAQTVDSPVKLKDPHAMTCAGCSHDLVLQVDLAAVGGGAAAADARTTAE